MCQAQIASHLILTTAPLFSPLAFSVAWGGRERPGGALRGQSWASRNQNPCSLHSVPWRLQTRTRGSRAQGPQVPDKGVKEKTGRQCSAPALPALCPRGADRESPGAPGPLTYGGHSHQGTLVEPGGGCLCVCRGGHQGLWPTASLNPGDFGPAPGSVEAGATPLLSGTSDARSTLCLLPVPGPGLLAAHGTNWAAGRTEHPACQL